MISGRSFDRVIGKVLEVPREKRKIVITVGIHPHEGTHRLIAPYEAQLAKKGVLVVLHPAELTPHAIWRRHEKAHTGTEFVPLDYSASARDRELEEAIASDAPNTLFFRFHGTPRTAKQKENFLWISPTSKITRSSNPNAFRTLSNRFKNVVPGGRPPNIVVLEYYYSGRPVSDARLSPFIRQALALEKQRYSAPNQYVKKIFHPADRHTADKQNIRPYYLSQPKITEQDVVLFHERHSATLLALIDHFLQNS